MLLTRGSLLAPLVSVAILGLTGCSDKSSPRFTATDEITKSFTTEDTPKVVVEVFNGAIDIFVVTEGEVHAKVLKKATGATEEAAEDDLENIAVGMIQEGDTIRVTAHRTDGRRGGGSGAAAEIQVPPGTVLDLGSRNGAISVTGLTGDVTGKTSNGGIQVKGSKGLLRLDTSNGRIRIEGNSPDMELSTSNGAIEIKAEKAHVKARTSNGGIRFEGSLDPGEHSLHSSNGAIKLQLPIDASFYVDAQTSNGRIATDFPVKRSPESSKNRLRGIVGADPSTTLRIRTSNGSIEIGPDQGKFARK